MAMSDPTPEEREWQRAAMALRLEVVASIAADVKAKGDAAIQAAVEAEREANARVASSFRIQGVMADYGHKIAAAIRARGEHE